MEDFFEIEDMMHTGVRDIWRARAKINLFDDVDGVKLAREIHMVVRVSKDDATPVAELMDAVYQECLACLTQAGQYMGRHTLADLRAKQRAEAEADLAGWDGFNEDDDAD